MPGDYFSYLKDSFDGYTEKQTDHLDLKINLICKTYNQNTQYFISDPYIIKAQRFVKEKQYTIDTAQCPYVVDNSTAYKTLLEAIMKGLYLDLTVENFIFYLRKFLNVDVFTNVDKYFKTKKPSYENNFLQWFSQLFSIKICIHSFSHFNHEIYTPNIASCHEIHLTKNHPPGSYTALLKLDQPKIDLDICLLYNKKCCVFTTIYHEKQDNILEYIINNVIDKLCAGYKVSYLDFSNSEQTSTLGYNVLHKVIYFILDYITAKSTSNYYDIVNFDLTMLKGRYLENNNVIAETKNYTHINSIEKKFKPIFSKKKIKDYIIDIHVITVKNHVVTDGNLVISQVMYNNDEKDLNLPDILKKNKMTYSDSITNICTNLDLRDTKMTDELIHNIKCVGNLSNIITPNVTDLKDMVNDTRLKTKNVTFHGTLTSYIEQQNGAQYRENIDNIDEKNLLPESSGNNNGKFNNHIYENVNNIYKLTFDIDNTSDNNPINNNAVGDNNNAVGNDNNAVGNDNDDEGNDNDTVGDDNDNVEDDDDNNVNERVMNGDRVNAYDNHDHIYIPDNVNDTHIKFNAYDDTHDNNTNDDNTENEKDSNVIYNIFNNVPYYQVLWGFDKDFIEQNPEIVKNFNNKFKIDDDFSSTGTINLKDMKEVNETRAPLNNQLGVVSKKSNIFGMSYKRIVK